MKDVNLPQMDIDIAREKTKWPHLADLNLPKVDGGLATVLLGADVFDLIVPFTSSDRPQRHSPCCSYSSQMDGCSAPTWPTKGTGHVLKVHVSTPDEDLHRQAQE